MMILAMEGRERSRRISSDTSSADLCQKSQELEEGRCRVFDCIPINYSSPQAEEIGPRKYTTSPELSISETKRTMDRTLNTPGTEDSSIQRQHQETYPAHVQRSMQYRIAEAKVPELARRSGTLFATIPVPMVHIDHRRTSWIQGSTLAPFADHLVSTHTSKPQTTEVWATIHPGPHYIGSVGSRRRAQWDRGQSLVAQQRGLACPPDAVGGVPTRTHHESDGDYIPAVRGRQHNIYGAIGTPVPKRV
ncbi:uncharacterized protein EI90DRAFT_3010830 [Cantharellus anzutake]|uniref:uncharacterized protein n=1 Tax=Cantharellus anzutake TaxID=1750568 RepID=UPI0019079D99|nr:uncharacterized protein EI90DRAFT_3010830 [Cantharellus anzutake]KAF8344003.1 hypothetical protein EI90DRAFT_3010830 [Cantharellus anzutake]